VVDSGTPGHLDEADEHGEAAARRLLATLLASGGGTRAAAAEAARITGISRRDAYRMALELSTATQERSGR
jgi:hypothetical protein